MTSLTVTTVYCELVGKLQGHVWKKTAIKYGTCTYMQQQKTFRVYDTG